ncbi:MmgE/PrpD family protein [Methylocystis sp. IM3]|uniref:MmgE/PrpD family protein n=1 Tax=unclassified Methylocystis TaxID=2625913 RepID=UPI0030F60188
MTEAGELAAFVERAQFSDLSNKAIAQLKIRVLDTVGVAVGALGAAPLRAIRDLTDKLGGSPLATLIGGGMTAPDRAAFYNGALSRYLDFMDSYIARGETCHPSDNLAAVMAAGEMARASGAEFLTALAIAYQIQTRLSDVAPVRQKGFDHTTQGAYAAAAGVAKALRLPRNQIANAIAISGAANIALRVTRTGALSNWKGLAYPNMAMAATHAALLAAHGVTGPRAVFEGNKGFKETISGPFEIRWLEEDLENVRQTALKKHNAEIHAQTAIEAVLDLRAPPGFHADAIKAVRLETFAVAYQIIGGGEEGDRHAVGTKEEADHSLPYLLAVALIDGRVQPEQFERTRIVAPDVQRLLRKVTVTPVPALSALFPARLPARLEIEFADGARLRASRDDYRGYNTDPFDWADARAKFDFLVKPFAPPQWAEEVVGVVHGLDERPLDDLTKLLACAGAATLPQNGEPS